MDNSNNRAERGDGGALTDWIREQLAASGPVPFARFMEWALYHPVLGYYSRGPNIGVRGDFVTSPEASPAFGILLATHVSEIDVLLSGSDPFTLVEFGPGNGTLMSDMLDTLRAEDAGLYARLNVILVEVSAALQSVQENRLAKHGDKVRWVASPNALPGGLSGTMLANEVLDAFPVHVLEKRGGRLLEHFVDNAEGTDFNIALLPPSDPALEEFLRKFEIELQEHERIEVNLALDGWLREVAAAWTRGVFTFIDYGDTAPSRYSPARKEGTLLGYHAGAVTEKVLARPGLQDLTALVDFTHLDAAARAAGLTPIGTTRQSNFLVGLGLGTGKTAIGMSGTLDEALEARQGIMSLVSPGGLGRFHVALFGKAVNAEDARKRLSGLKYADIG